MKIWHSAIGKSHLGQTFHDKCPNHGNSNSNKFLTNARGAINDLN